MSKENERLAVCYIVTCYQNVVGVYASQAEASQVQIEMILKNRPVDVLCRSIVYPLNS